MKNLIIVESPAKAKTIKKFLGDDYDVVASKGHIRDLPQKKFGIKIKDKSFEPEYEISADHDQIVKQIKTLAKKADQIYLATDEDREGEAIAYHIAASIGKQAEELPRDLVAMVTTPEVYVMETDQEDAPHIAALDFGVKRSILENINRLGAKITVLPAYTSAEEVLALNPDGIFLSNGPGDPQDVPEIVAEIQKMAGKKPIFGICLGHQLLALAFGAKTYKMKFGHRGGNQPVKNLRMNRVHISAQNHGYAVDPASLEGTPLVITHTNVNDDTVEGLRHTSLPIFSVQYHPEAAPGPDDNMYLFDGFWALMKGE